MTDHLPECEADCGFQCICADLRACEQRVLDDDVLAAAYHGEKGYTMGYAAALNAAEAAVLKVHQQDGDSCEFCRDLGSSWEGWDDDEGAWAWPCKTVAAIRALKEKR